MIELPGGLAIIADEHQYIVGRPRKAAQGDNKAGKMSNPGYYRTLACAVKEAAAQAMREKVRTDEITGLKEFIAEYQKVIAEIQELTEPLNV